MKKSRGRKALAAACADVTLGEKLGDGGNAEVYAGVSALHGDVAVKFMLNSNTKRYARFRDEVLVVTTRLVGSPYVVPILQYSLPAAITDSDVPWYVMPIARRLNVALEGLAWTARLEALSDLAEGLAALHAESVAHRDIKPENLFELNGSHRFGDFGLAAFPESSSVTESNEPMGPWAYMAPEMLVAPKLADPLRADVYSFAKTVWAVLTEQRVPFFGHYAADSVIGLASFPGARVLTVEPLDALIEESTRVVPEERPSAEAFAKRLRQVLAIQDDYRSANKLQWEAAEVAALHSSGLTRAVWHGAAAIAAVLSTLSRRHGLNHCFYPDGGGMALSGASTCEGGEMLALHLEGSGREVVKPFSLTLERFEGRPELSYAVLQTDDMPPLGAGSRVTLSGEAERLWQLNEWDYGVDDRDVEEPKYAGHGIFCERRFKAGTFIIAPTTGVFNEIDDYLGTEGKVEGLRAEFEAYARELSGQEHAMSSINQPRRTARLLSDGDITSHQLALEHVDQELLARLVDCDDALAKPGAETRSIVNYGDIKAIRAMHQRTPQESAALAVLAGMTKEQRAELMALVDIGRGNGRLGRTKQIAQAYLDDLPHVEYLLRKLGNGYLRKALGRFGLEWPRPS